MRPSSSASPSCKSRTRSVIDRPPLSLASATNARPRERLPPLAGCTTKRIEHEDDSVSRLAPAIPFMVRTDRARTGFHRADEATRNGSTANHRSVGTDIATVSEEGSGILSGDAVERGSECVLQRLDGACGDPAEVGFHLGLARLNRAEVRTIAGQVAIGKA